MRQGIKALIDDFHARGQTIIFYNVKPSIAEVFRGVRPREFLHCASRADLERLLRASASRHQQGPRLCQYDTSNLLLYIYFHILSVSWQSLLYIGITVARQEELTYIFSLEFYSIGNSSVTFISFICCIRTDNTCKTCSVLHVRNIIAQSVIHSCCFK